MALQAHERYLSGLHEQLPDAPANGSKLGTGTQSVSLDHPLIETIFRPLKHYYELFLTIY